MNMLALTTGLCLSLLSGPAWTAEISSLGNAIAPAQLKSTLLPVAVFGKTHPDKIEPQMARTGSISLPHPGLALFFAHKGCLTAVVGLGQIDTVDERCLQAENVPGFAEFVALTGAAPPQEDKAHVILVIPMGHPPHVLARMQQANLPSEAELTSAVAAHGPEAKLHRVELDLQQATAD